MVWESHHRGIFPPIFHGGHTGDSIPAKDLLTINIKANVPWHAIFFSFPRTLKFLVDKK